MPKKLNKTRFIAIIIMLLACLFIFVACNNSPTPDTVNDTADEMAEDIRDAGEDIMDGTDNNQEQKGYVLYFANKDRNALVAETRGNDTDNVTKKNTIDAKARMVVSELIEGPKNENLLPVLPRTTMINAVTLDENGVMNLDLSNTFADDFNDLDIDANLTVNAIAATLMQYPEIKKVRITVDNNPLKLGTDEYTEAIVYDKDLISKK
ncbi:MAG: GerMN domain-containing protein [Bacillota bacterium]